MIHHLMNSSITFANERFQLAVLGKAQKVPPIWFMRQAGRYHSHYRNLKEKYSFLELCKNPELAAEVALGPIKEFGFDVSILFSDILFPLEAMGLGLDYNPGPVITNQIQSESDFLQLRDLDSIVSHLQFQKKAVECTREILPKDVSLIGFIGGPWTLFNYAISQKQNGYLSTPKSNPKLIKLFYDKIIPVLVQNICLQLEGGAELIMILDTLGGDLSPDWFEEFVVKPLNEISLQFPGRIGYYTKGSTLEQMKSLKTIQGLAGIGVDHRFSIENLLKNKVSPGFLQGNFDQSFLFLSPDEFTKIVKRYLDPIKSLTSEERIGWVSGLGHGIKPGTPEDNVKRLVEMIREEFQ
jgi:uroporphyrinogen decarboxylase